MADVAAVLRRPTLTGAEMTYTQVPAPTDVLVVDEGTKVHVRNASASGVTVTYDVADVNGLTVTPPAGMVVAAGADRVVPAPSSSPYVHPDGKVRIGFSATAATITAAVFE